MFFGDGAGKRRMGPLSLGTRLNGDHILMAHQEHGLERGIASPPDEKKIVRAHGFVGKLCIDLRKRLFKISMKSAEGLFCGSLLLRCSALLPRNGLEWNGTGKIARRLLWGDFFGGGRKDRDLLRGNEKGARDHDDGEHQHQQPDEFQYALHVASWGDGPRVHGGNEPNMLCHEVPGWGARQLNSVSRSESDAATLRCLNDSNIVIG